MKILRAVTVSAVMSTGALAGQTNNREVTVCLNPGSNAVRLFRAEATAAQAFGAIGVKLRWKSDPQSCGTAEYSIVITLSENTPADQHPGALAYAFPFEGTRIVLFYDRVLSSVQPAMVPFVLAHVMVHEITHVLQGIEQHSASGMMKQKWEHRDYVDMQRKPLGFTADDVRLIHHGLDRRASRLAAANAARVK